MHAVVNMSREVRELCLSLFMDVHTAMWRMASILCSIVTFFKEERDLAEGSINYGLGPRNLLEKSLKMSKLRECIPPTL